MEREGKEGREGGNRGGEREGGGWEGKGNSLRNGEELFFSHFVFRRPCVPVIELAGSLQKSGSTSGLKLKLSRVFAQNSY